MDIQYLKSLLDYNPENGLFKWKMNRGARPAGSIAGCCNKRHRNRIDIMIDGKSYLAHRLAWAWMTGRFPENQIDHKDLNPENNKWENLRLATNQQNCCNRRKRVDNTSGYKGVSFHRASGKYQAQINGKSIGYFLSKKEAYIEYSKAAKSLHLEFMRIS